MKTSRMIALFVAAASLGAVGAGVDPSLPLAGALIGTGAFFVLSSRTAAIAVATAGGYLYFAALQLSGNVNSRPLTGGYYMVLTFICLALMMPGQMCAVRRAWSDVLLFGCLCGWMLVRWLLAAPSEDAALKMSFAPFFMVVPFVAGVFVSNARRLESLQHEYLLLGAGLALLTAVGIGSGSLAIAGVARVSPVSGWNPISHAMTLCAVVIIVAAKGDRNARSVAKWGYAGLALTAFVLAVLSGSRGPIIATVAASTLAVVLHGRDRLASRVALGAAAGLLALGIVWSVPEPVRARFDPAAVSEQNLEVNSVWLRSVAFRASWDLFADNPVIGAGVGGFSELSGTGLVYPHNIPLEVLSELGLIGIVPLVLLGWRTADTAVRLIRSYGIRCAEGAGAAMFFMAFVESFVSGSVQTSPWLWFWSGVMASRRARAITSLPKGTGFTRPLTHDLSGNQFAQGVAAVGRDYNDRARFEIR
jgi:O-antigen ligase